MKYDRVGFNCELRRTAEGGLIAPMTNANLIWTERWNAGDPCSINMAVSTTPGAHHRCRGKDRHRHRRRPSKADALFKSLTVSAASWRIVSPNASGQR